ncbi:MAG: hypothetical protein WC565_06145 [Parcubacteria group bacterium]
MDWSKPRTTEPDPPHSRVIDEMMAEIKELELRKQMAELRLQIARLEQEIAMLKAPPYTITYTTNNAWETK